MNIKRNSFLDKIIAEKKKEIKKLKEEFNNFEFSVLEEKFKLYKIFQKDNSLKIISEFKKASPSMGLINPDAKIEKYIKIFSKYADAISILTDKKFFNGDIDYIREARKFTDLPILAKDFYLHPVQIKRAAYFGANAILIIAKILTKTQIKTLYEEAEKSGLDSIFEIHSKDDLNKILDNVSPRIVGINTRDLSTFEIHNEVIDKLVPLIPKNIYIIAESGIKEPSELERIKDKVNGILIGTAIMKESQPEKFLKKLKSYAKL